jgi:hypothetical protein
VPPARDAAVEDVQDEGDGNEERGHVEVDAVLGGEELHRLEDGRDAAEPVGDGEEVRKMKVADHRKMSLRPSLRHLWRSVAEA